jgi:superfamily II DNA or RNA helicase
VGVSHTFEVILDSYPPVLVQRGRQYAKEGRVRDIRNENGECLAVVHGTQRYEVAIGLEADDPDELDVGCTCPAYERELVCKHIAALAWAMMTSQRDVLAPAPRPGAVPRVLEGLYTGVTVLERMSLFTGQVVPKSPSAQWHSMTHMWRQLPAKVRASIITHAPEVEQAIKTLAGWSPPRAPLPGTVFAEVYTRLAAIYIRERSRAALVDVPPGPLDGRHPGFIMRFDSRGGRFVATERESTLLGTPKSFAFRLLPPSNTEVTFDSYAFSRHEIANAWELFALRAVLIALAERTDEAVRELESEIGRPVWEQLLSQLSTDGDATEGPKEWAFTVAPTYGDAVVLTAYSRVGRKWKKDKFDDLYSSAELPLEREIARLALMIADRPPSARFVLGTAHGHEVLRLLARHPRVHVPKSAKPNLETDPRVELYAGDLTMRLEPVAGGTLVPRFLVEGKEFDLSLLEGDSPFRAGHTERRIVSAYVPPALRQWVATAEKMGRGLAFPPESLDRLVKTAEPLVARGVAELPREALGTELTSAPACAVRVEWHPRATVAVELLISVHPSAPLVAAGLGPALFTFEYEGARVFVERDFAREVTLLEEARRDFGVSLVWADGIGRTAGAEDAFALAGWLDTNPLGLRIEVKIGRPPSVVAWSAASPTLSVRREGAWLVLDGALHVEGVDLTLGDVLEAVRLARRYVEAKEGLFLQLSEEVLAKLGTVAVATELAPDAGTEGSIRVHEAFASVLADARASFGTVRGFDLETYARRFDEREKSGRVPDLEHGALRPYQREGVRWMLELSSWAPGCILADDMGLGKTVQTASLLKARGALGPQLIVAPASVASNWIAELERFMPSLRTRFHNEERAMPAELGKGDVLVISYGLLQRQRRAFEGVRFATVVVDEAQYVKNTTAQRSDAVRVLERDFTLALTGTPLENHLGELFSIVDLVFPGLLGSAATFRERFRKPIEGQKDPMRLAVLGRLLSPFLLRRTRAAVLTELPEREEITETIDLAPDETKRYLALRRACEAQFAKRGPGETAAQLKIALLAALTRLRQLACDVRLVDRAFEGSSTKIDRTVELADEIAQGGHATLVFSQFTTFLEMVRDALVDKGLRVAYLAGDTPTAKRRAIVEAFQAGEYDVFCVSLLAGGTGLNLTRASYVIHTDPWWNPAAEEQATSRAHRMGQTEPVTVYRLVARGTIEEAVLSMHASKKDLARSVLEGKGEAKTVSSVELLELLRFGE